MKFEQRAILYNFLKRKGFKNEHINNSNMSKYFMMKFIDKEKNIIIIKFNREVIK